MESTYAGTGAEMQHRAAAVPTPAPPLQVVESCAWQHALAPSGQASAGRAVPRRPTQRSSNATRRCTRYLLPKWGLIDCTLET
jgi:hypothetical protein